MSGNWIPDTAERMAGTPIVVSLLQAEGTMLVAPDISVGTTSSSVIVMHPVDFIRVRMVDEDPWDVFNAIAEWRLDAALRVFDRRQDLRRRRVGVALWRHLRRLA